MKKNWALLVPTNFLPSQSTAGSALVTQGLEVCPSRLGRQRLTTDLAVTEINCDRRIHPVLNLTLAR